MVFIRWHSWDILKGSWVGALGLHMRLIPSVGNMRAGIEFEGSRSCRWVAGGCRDLLLHTPQRSDGPPTVTNRPLIFPNSRQSGFS